MRDGSVINRSQLRRAIASASAEMSTATNSTRGRNAAIDKPIAPLPEQATTGDFDGDGRLDHGVRLPHDNKAQWYVRCSSGGLINIVTSNGPAPSMPAVEDYDGDGKAREVESLLFLDSAFSLRLLRAYSKIKDQTVQRQLVSLMESIAANED